MIIFDTFKNSFFKSITRIILDLQQGKEHTPVTVRKIIAEDLFNYENRSLDKMVDFVFPTRNGKNVETAGIFELKNDKYSLSEPEAMPIVATTQEYRWLYMMLSDPLITPHISESLRLKLLLELEKRQLYCYYDKYWVRRRLYYEEADRSLIADKLSKIRMAIEERCNLSYSYRNKQEVIKAVCEPYNIEYSPRMDKYWLLALVEDANGPKRLKMPLTNLFGLQVSPTKSKFTAEQITEELERIKKSTPPIILRLNLVANDSEEKRKNTIERTMSLFALWKSSLKYEPDGICELTIGYYREDRQEILRDIISMGSLVTVIAPNDVRDEIKARISGALQRYKNGRSHKID